MSSDHLGSSFGSYALGGLGQVAKVLSDSVPVSVIQR